MPHSPTTPVRPPSPAAEALQGRRGHVAEPITPPHDDLAAVRGAEGYWLPGQREDHAHHFMVEDFHPRVLRSPWPAPLLCVPQGIAQARARQEASSLPRAIAAAHRPPPAWVLAAVAARPCGAPVGPGAPPPQVGIDVHAPGRGRATRRALAAVMLQHPDALHPPHGARPLDSLHAHLATLQVQHHFLARRRHASGLSVLQAAQRALALMQQPPSRAHNAVAVAVAGIDSLSMLQVCALVWHAIAQLQPAGYAAAEVHPLRAERGEAFVSALADCIDAGGEAHCAAGMAQRLVLTLQGVVPGVHIEPPTPAQER